MTASAQAPFRTDGAPTYCTVRQAVRWLTDHGRPCSREWLYERIREGKVRQQVQGARRTMRVLLADVERLLPAPPMSVAAEREPSAFERAAALVPSLDDGERRELAVRCLTAPKANETTTEGARL